MKNAHSPLMEDALDDDPGVTAPPHLRATPHMSRAANSIALTVLAVTAVVFAL